MKLQGFKVIKCLLSVAKVVFLHTKVIPVPNEKAEDLKGLFMEMGSEKNMEFDMLDDETDLKEVKNFYSEADC